MNNTWGENSNINNTVIASLHIQYSEYLYVNEFYGARIISSIQHYYYCCCYYDESMHDIPHPIAPPDPPMISFMGGLGGAVGYVASCSSNGHSHNNITCMQQLLLCLN